MLKAHLEERVANKTRELEFGFDKGFEDLRALQWLLHKRGLEEELDRKIVAAELQMNSRGRSAATPECCGQR